MKTIYLNASIGEYQRLYLPDGMEKKEELNLEINSGGGDTKSAIGMYDLLMREKRFRKITTIGVGAVESAAVTPFIAADYRLSYPNTSFMFHACLLNANGVNCSLVTGWLKFTYITYTHPIINRLVQISNKDRKFWGKLFEGDKVYFTAKEMKRMGVVTKIL